ncbi:MAG TPA: phthalate transporter [Brevundimonas sp.]|jgi:hypothetical protein
MIPTFERPEDLPGQQRVMWRPTPGARIGASLAAVCWPPLLLTFFIWPPTHWIPGREIDWRLVVLFVGLIAAPTGLWLMGRERDRTGLPASRLGIVWRFMLYGGLLGGALAVLFALIQVIIGAVFSGSVMQALGSTETILLIYGVGGLPVAILVGVSYALWAGLCAAFLAFEPAPEKVRDRLGVMRTDKR